MKNLLLFLLISLNSLCAGDIESYFRLLDQYPQTLGPLGDAQQGEIEIIQDRKKIEELEQTMGRKIGIVAQDKYWLWINDPVKFPSGKYGVYGRFLWQQSLKGAPGVAVMAVLPDGRIVLNRNYRHATRSWEYELPRGARGADETSEAAAVREVKEETGMVLDKISFLGNMTVDTGFTNSIVPIFMAKVIHQDKATPEDSEAIAGIEAFSLKELKEGYINGYLLMTEKGKTVKIPLRDPFLTFALFQAELRKL